MESLVKTAFITGASRGIGNAIAKKFLEKGYRLVLLHREKQPDFEPSDMVHFLKADQRDQAAISQWLESWESKGNKVDILINNAGVIFNTPLIDVSEAQWDDLMDINLKSTFFLSQCFAKHMITNRSGVIINATSFATKLPLPGRSIYAASKSGLLSLTKTMATEWAPYGIRVNAYAPGIVETDMSRPAIEQNGERLKDDISLRRFGLPSEVADAVYFLCSDDAAYITGIELDISGGKFLTQNPAMAWDTATEVKKHV
jgi:NAD(P)-dependent dehydrogenase (short-subunit alcohol dehydrogenase family)